MSRISCPLNVLKGLRVAGPILVMSLLIAGLSAALPERSHAYIMPSEQLIKFLATHFSKFETLILEQLTLQERGGEGGGQEVFREIISMKSPNLFHSRVVSSNMGGRERPADVSYRQVIMANTVKGLTDLLSGMGIDLEQVAFTRIDGIIAYRIGDREPDSPKILIEKARFIPLLLTYRSPPGTNGDRISIRFTDYRQLEQGWYPFEIICSFGDKDRETYWVDTLQANVPIDRSLFSSSERAPSPGGVTEGGRSPSDEERLRQVIKKFEEKYGQ